MNSRWFRWDPKGSYGPNAVRGLKIIENISIREGLGMLVRMCGRGV